MSTFLCNSDENPDKEIQYLEQMHGEIVAGIIFSPTHKIADTFSELVDADLPMVS